MVQPIDTKLDATGFTITLQGGRPENQDAVRSLHTPLGTVIVVCDGMGGMQGGRIASEIAVNTILETIIQAEAQSNPEMTLIKAIRNANMAILQEGQLHAELKGMGTTAAVVLLSEKSALVAYVGDTRIYQLRNTKKVYRTFDHSMVFEMVRKNVITEEQARLSAQSNIILRALGVKPDLEVETTELPYRKGDKFLLCSDGFWGSLPEKEFLHLLSGNKRMDRKLEEAARRIDQIGRQKGGDHDNLTAAIITMNTNSILKEKMNRAAKMIITVLATLLVVSVGCNIWLTSRSHTADATTLAGDSTTPAREKEQMDSPAPSLGAPADSATSGNPQENAAPKPFTKDLGAAAPSTPQPAPERAATPAAEKKIDAPAPADEERQTKAVVPASQEESTPADSAPDETRPDSPAV